MLFFFLNKHVSIVGGGGNPFLRQQPFLRRPRKFKKKKIPIFIILEQFFL